MGNPETRKRKGAKRRKKTRKVREGRGRAKRDRRMPGDDSEV